MTRCNVGLWFIAIVLASSCGKKKEPATDEKQSTKPPPVTIADASAGTTGTAVTGIVPAPVDLKADPGGNSGKGIWLSAFGGVGGEYVRAVAVAADGGAAITGYFDKPIQIGALGERVSQGEVDAVVIRVGPDGAAKWVQTLGAKRADVGNGVALAPDGSAVVVGNFLDDVTVGGLVGKAAGSDDLFALGLDPQGTPTWLLTAGSVDSDGANAVAASADGWVIGGSFMARAEVLGQSLKAVGGTDAWLIKVGRDGKVLWAKQFGGTAADNIKYVAVDNAGNTIVAGSFAATTNFGGSDLTVAGGDDTDIVVAKYDPQGNHVWSQRFGGRFNDAPGGVAVDPSGHIAITGGFEDSIVFGDGEYKSKGQVDAFAARLDPSGKLLWARTFGSPRPDAGLGVASDASGNVIVSGWFKGPIDLGGTAITNNNGSQDIFVVKYGPTGTLVWAQRFGDKDNDQGLALGTSPDGSITLGGVFNYDLEAPGVATVKAARNADGRNPLTDMFLMRLSR